MALAVPDSHSNQHGFSRRGNVSAPNLTHHTFTLLRTSTSDTFNPNMMRSRTLLLAAVSVFLAACTSTAQQAPQPAVTQAVLAGKLIDVRSGEVRSHVYILIAGDRVQSIAQSAPTGIPIDDLSAYTVLPGLIDAHGHILSNPTTQNFAAHLRTSIPQATVWGVYNLRLWLNHGFTSVRDACEGPADYPQFALRASVKRGMILGPRITAAGSCISITGGHGDGAPFSPDLELPRGHNTADTVDDEIERASCRDRV